VVERFAQRQVLAPLGEVAERLPEWLAELAGEAAAEVAREGVPAAEVEVRRRLVSLRFSGQESAVEVAWEEGADLPAAFAVRYQELYGYRPAGRAVEVESLRAVASSKAPADDPPTAVGERQPATASRRQRAFLGGRWQEAPVFERAELAAGATFAGPALVVERHSATVVAPGWSGEVDGAGTLVLTPPPE
jgi:N-methylhydantoinase A/oxoprolinase/acetone carboxylase beta subunit